MNNDIEKQLRSTLIAVEDLEDIQHHSSKPFGAVSSMREQASVLVPLLKKADDYHLLLTLRAANMRHHAGEVAFPGGMWEVGDRHLVDTALRECEEEIAIPSADIHVIGALDTMPTRRLTNVRPVVGILDNIDSVVASPEEIAEVFTVPLDFFKQDKRLRTDIFPHQTDKTVRWVPAFQYRGFEIWGFTAAVIVQLLRRSFDIRFSREHGAPEKIW
ncbi:NUDIX hydrolase [Eionea flava]